jgi:hypothetical protein
MDAIEIRELLREELPKLVVEDPATQQLILRLARNEFANRVETQSRFDRVLEELRQDREIQTRKWEEQNRKWDEQNRKWDEQNQSLKEQNRKWDEQNRKWDEQNQSLKEQNRKWDEQNRKWNEQNQKWWENQRKQDEIMAEIKQMNRHIDIRIGAMGARWGRESESAFRAALRAILEESFGVQVINVVEFDETGEVHGRPDQVELDLIIKNGLLIICEIKSSVSKSDMYAFYRAAKFYEKKHARQANRLIVISPMIDKRAYRVAQQLGIEAYHFPDDVPVDDLELT